MNRILLIDDAPEIRELVKSVLSDDYLVVEATSLAEASTEISKENTDLILLDVMLPDGNGFNFCATIKQEPAHKNIPVIFLTGKSDTSDKVLGFSLGAEDYLPKPFDPLELKSRVQARLRDLNKNTQENNYLRKGNLLFRLSQQKIYILQNDVEQQLDFTPLEYKLLLHFIRHEDQVFTRDQLMDAIWHDDVTVYDRTIDVHISNIRKKIEDSQYKIKAVHGVGYRCSRKDG